MNLTRMKPYISIMMVFLLSSCNFEKPSHGERDQSLNFISNLENPVIVPYESVNGLIVIKLQINKSGPLNFILDTGSPITCIFESDRNSGFKDPFGDRDDITTFTKAMMKTPIEFIDGLQVKIGDSILMENTPVALWPPGLFFNSQSYDSIPYDGIVGYDLFRYVTVEIDQDARTLTLSNTKDQSLREGWVYSDLEFKDKDPFCDINIRVRPEDEMIPLKVHLDLGNMNHMWVKENPDKGIVAPGGKEQVIGQTIEGKPLQGILWPIHNLEIMGFDNYGIPIRFISSGHSYDQSREGYLGLNELESFDLLIDYTHHRFGLRLRRERFIIGEADLEMYEGTYSSSDISHDVTLERRRNLLYCTAQGQNSLPLTTISEVEFRFKPADITVIFEKDTNGDVDYTTYTLHQNKKKFVYKRR